MQPSSEASRELHCRPASERDDDLREIRERPNVTYAMFYGYFRGDIDLEAYTSRANDQDVSNSSVHGDNGQSAASLRVIAEPFTLTAVRGLVVDDALHGDAIASRNPSSKDVAPDTSTSDLRYCSSCRHSLPAATHFLPRRKTCASCLRYHKRYARRKRKREKADAHS